MTKNRFLGVLLAALAASGCDLDLNDPNFPTEEVVFGDGQNLLAIGIGIQAEAAAMMGPFIFSTSLTTDEMGAGAASFPNFQSADRGEPLLAAQYLSEQPWIDAYRVVKLADDLLGAVPDANLRADTKSGLLAMAGSFKAMAFGHLATLYESAPIEAGIDNPSPAFAPRQELLEEAIALLEAARSQIANQAPGDEFNTSVRAPGFDLAVTIDALLARYNLMAGNLGEAVAAAERVPAQARSEFRFSPTDPNPVYTVMYNSGNAWQLRARQLLRLEAEEGDERVAYWVTPASIVGASFTLDDLTRYRSSDEAFAVFLPDEMKLIRAEALARQNDLDGARALINAVRTQCPADVSDEPAACLPARSAAELPNQAAVLEEVLWQRRYELFLQGVRIDDLRRFDAPRKYDFAPWPQSECDQNANAPCGG